MGDMFPWGIFEGIIKGCSGVFLEGVWGIFQGIRGGIMEVGHIDFHIKTNETLCFLILP